MSDLLEYVEQNKFKKCEFILLKSNNFNVLCNIPKLITIYKS